MAKSRHDKRRERDAKQDKAATVVPAAVNVTQSVTPQVPGSEICSQFALIIEILDAWHPGSGRGRGLQFDATALRDEDGFPYLTGRHLRGLIPVSYTHLDVYKRQALHAAGSLCRSEVRSCCKRLGNIADVGG